MPTRADVVNEAQKWVGYTEGPRNNETIFGGWSGYQFQPWCGSFTDYVLTKCGFTITSFGSANSEPSSVYTPSGILNYKKLGRFMDRLGPCEPGDVVYFDFQRDGLVDHVGLVVSSRGALVDTIEGNTSFGNQSNGGEVMRRTRDRAMIAGFGRPMYSFSPIPQESLVNPLEVDMYIAVDGVGFFAQVGNVTIPLPGIDLVGFAKLMESNKSVGCMIIPKAAAQDFAEKVIKQTVNATKA
jgi:hypothetical protein